MSSSVTTHCLSVHDELHVEGMNISLSDNPLLTALRGVLHVLHCSSSVKRVDCGLLCNSE